MQLVQYRDFRPWFDSMGGVAFFTAARETARKYPEDCSDAEAQLTVVLSRLARAPPAFLSGDPERMEVTTTPQGSKQLSTVYKGSEIVERPPAACAAAGCSASGPALKQCSACRAVSYCCQECQKKGCVRRGAHHLPAGLILFRTFRSSSCGGMSPRGRSFRLETHSILRQVEGGSQAGVQGPRCSGCGCKGCRQGWRLGQPGARRTFGCRSARLLIQQIMQRS